MKQPTPNPDPMKETTLSPQMKNIPQKIYLQVDPEDESQEDFNQLREVTWHKERIYNNDIEYVLSSTSPYRMFEAVPVSEELPTEDNNYFVFWTEKEEDSGLERIIILGTEPFENGEFLNDADDGRGYVPYSKTHYAPPQFWLRPVLSSSPKEEITDEMIEKIFPTDHENSGEDDDMERLNVANAFRQEGAKCMRELTKSK